MKKLDYVDTLRCLAILGVILVHTHIFLHSDLPQKAAQIIDLGAKGVQLFFLASALTLFLSFEKRITKETYPIKNFYVRRIFRIAPMYYLAICYYLLQYSIANHDASAKLFDISIPNIIAEFTFLHGYNPYWINHLVPGGWSIAVEMTFYAVLPLIFLKIKNINQAFLFFTGALTFAFLLNLWFTAHPLISSQLVWTEFLYFYFPNQLPVFCLGIIMYFMIIKSQGLKNISRQSWIIFAACVLIPLPFLRETILSVNIIASIGLLMFAILLSKGKLSFLINPVTKYIGVRSFSMYLLHFAVIFWLTKMNLIKYVDNMWLDFVLSYLVITALTVALSSIFYALIEVPFQNLGKKLIDKWEIYTSVSKANLAINVEEKLIDQQF